MDVKVTTFINPHLFWILDRKNRTLLQQLDRDLQQLWSYSKLHHFEVDEIVAVQVNSRYYRAVIKSIAETSAETDDQKKYMCWLLDYGTMIDTGKLCKLPKKIQMIPPIAKQASLNKVGCIITQLSYDNVVSPVNPVIKNIKSHIPSPATRSTAMSLIENTNTIIFHKEDTVNGIVVGDLLYEKDKTMFSLRRTLCEQQMLVEDDMLFTQIINGIQEYKEEHLMDIHRICRRNKICHLDSTLKLYSEDEMVETDIETSRTNLAYSNKKTSTNESENESPSSENMTNSNSEENQRRLLNLQRFYSKNNTQKIDDNLTEETNYSSDTNSDHLKPQSRRQKLLAILKNRSIENSPKPTIEETASKLQPVKHSSGVVKVPENVIITAGGIRNMPTKRAKTAPKHERTSDSEQSSTRSSCYHSKIRTRNQEKFDSMSESENNSEISDNNIRQKRTQSCQISAAGDNNIRQKRAHGQSCQISAAGAPYKAKNKHETSVRGTTSETEVTDGQLKPCIMNLPRPCGPCGKCNHWSKESGFKIDTEYNKKASKATKLTGGHKAPPLLKTVNSPINKIIAIDYGNISGIEKMRKEKMLVHGSTIPIPIYKVADAAFHANIHEALQNLNYSETKRTQMYVWPSIFRQQHTCLINKSNTGKTMAYLPVMCSFILEKADYFRDFPRTGGPIVVILCRSSMKCETVYDLIWQLLRKSKTKVSVVLGTNPLTHINTSNVDILVTVPGAFLAVLASKAVNLKRLCHFVIDDADVIMKNYDSIMNKIFNLINNMLENRISTTKKVQLIMCGEHWSKKIEDICKNLHENIFVCIPNHLEAALYGGMEFKVRFQDSSCKEMTLRNLIKDRYHIYRTVIFCAESELDQLDTVLMLDGIEKVVIGKELDKEDLLFSEELWKADLPGKFRVLVITDYVFSTEIPITNAMILIHYSLPLTWTKFTKRFTCFLENIKSPLVEHDNNLQIECHVLIDEASENQIKKFLQFLKQSGIMPDNISDYFDNVVRVREQEKIKRKKSLCPILKLFGKCMTEECSARHTVDNDLDVINIDLPKNGAIKFKIVEILDVTHFTIKLISHTDLNGNRTYFEHNVTENSTDEKNSVINMYLANLIPPLKDECFSAKSFFKLKSLLKERDYENAIFTGQIYLQLNDTLWLKNVVEEVELESRITVCKFKLCRKMIEMHLVEENVTPLNNLYKLCIVNNIKLPSYEIQVKVEKKLAEQMQPQWAYFEPEMDKLNEVIFCAAVSPDEFYVRRQKFNSQLYKLQQNMQDAIKRPSYHLEFVPTIGKCYLAQDPVELDYARVVILNKDEEKALCFFVDFGDEILVNLKDLKYLSNDFISVLPFQTIRCSLYGVQPVLSDWQDDATEIFYNYSFEPGTDNFRLLYAKYYSKVTTDSGQYSYKIILKDGFGSKNILINNLMIDCGCAVNVDGEVIEDFQLTKTSTDSDCESKQFEQIENESVEENQRIIDEYEEKQYYLDVCDDMDLVFYDPHKFMCQIYGDDENILPQPKITKQLPAITNTPLPALVPSTSENVRKSVAAPCGHLTPSLTWSQTEKHVKLTILLVDVKNYNVSIIRNRLFKFKAILNEKTYALNLLLFDRVEPNLHHTTLGPQVRIKITKAKEELWSKLVTSKDRFPNIRYDLETIDVEDEKEKKILTLPAEFGENIAGNSDDEDQLRYFDISDRDSSYEEEIDSSSD